MNKTSTLSLPQRIAGALCVAIAAILWLLFQIPSGTQETLSFMTTRSPSSTSSAKGELRCSTTSR